MRRRLLKSKIHRATVTGADLNYIGSVSIDTELMAVADIVEHELVTVLDLNNGQRLETYAISGKPGQICLNGAAARLIHPRDLVILLTYTDLEPDEIATHEPTIVLVGEDNAVTEVLSGDPEQPGRAG